ncbi:AAA family ATPase [bacterium]|nr:AAA family ATPase [bacterium]MBU1995200.1 AAA family ATPase [bacterium]
MNKKITNEHIKDVYSKFKKYYQENQNNFLELTQKHIVEEIVKIIKLENKFEWNIASLTDYLNNLVYMIKGQQFARTINKFSEHYFIEHLCSDFGESICQNAKKSLELHKKYYKNITGRSNEAMIENEINKGNQNMLSIKNIILYGAPGVGKTHNYKNLISMIEEGKGQKEIFDTISENRHVELENEIYESIKQEKRVEFVTFHQSYSYEDFIEGFRPNESGNIELEDGIFKTISTKAFGKININKTMSIGREIKSDRSTYIIESVTSDLINIKKEKDNRIVPMPKKLVVELIENIKNSTITLEDIKNRNLENIDTSFDKYMYGYNSILYAICNNIVNEVEYNEQKNFYIVIDEINRGNISKIFGELITLIEEDKRDVYEVTLPYSKEKFKVPSNLYIIATMNSTDKSIATIDIALRRRFTFLKMKPNVELVSFPHAKELFNKLNIFIAENLNEDYKLGHSYFMNVANDEDLEFVKEYKIKPLLEEYFYVDNAKLNLALNILKSENIND